MRKKYILIAAILLSAALGAQIPRKMSYQAIIRDATGNIIKTQAGMQISILQGTSTGTPVYVERQTAVPDEKGIVTFNIGDGIPVTSGTISEIDWSAGPYFIQTETDPTGGTSYSLTGINQLLSVPYTLYAKAAGGHYIGEFFGGGIIVAVTKTGNTEHGLIASLTNLGPNPGSPWSEDITTLIGPEAESLTDGQANTITIIAQAPAFENAAKLCDDYTNPDTGTGVYSDWYLPAIKELKECYDAKFAVTNILGIVNGFLFDNYWSSTENKDDSLTSFFIGFHIGILNPGGHKGHLLRVRAVRKF